MVYRPKVDINIIPLENIATGNSLKSLVPETLKKEYKAVRDAEFKKDMALISHFLHSSEYMDADDYARAEDLIERYFAAAHPSIEYPQEFSLNDKLHLFDSILYPPFPSIQTPTFSFIDLFAGIGGFRLALQQLGGKCVFASEIDDAAKKTYTYNYGVMPFGDITTEETKSLIPHHFDILCAGFPCQAFSMAGLRLGFRDKTKGTLFYDVAEIIARYEPAAFFLENVKGLLSHDHGRTIEIILGRLRELGYYVPEPEVVNAMNFGVPQNRERVFIVGFHPRTGVYGNFHYPEPTNTQARFRDVKEPDTVDVKYYLSQKYWQTLVDHKERHRAKGNGFGYEIIGDDDVANTFMAGAMGREHNLVIDERQTLRLPDTKYKGATNDAYVRSLTPREAAGLQGFPRTFVIPVADYPAYKQFGNSVPVPAIRETARQILNMLNLRAFDEY